MQVTEIWKVIRQYWTTFSEIALIAAIGTTTIRWFQPAAVFSDLPSLLYIASFAMYLASQKVSGRALLPPEKAFCYFGCYLLVFFVLENHLRSIASGNLAIRLLSALFIPIISLALYQTHRFRLESKRPLESQLVLLFGFLSIGCLIFMIGLLWIKG